MQIDVKSVDVQTKHVTAKDGRSFTFREQQSCFVNLNGEYRQVVITLGAEQQPYPIGRYEIEDKSFFVGRFGQIGLRNQLSLRLVASAKAA